MSLSTIDSDSFEEELRQALARFGYTSLSTEQDLIIRESIQGRDVLGVLPTGGGKSACYQIPGVVRKAKTIVVSPLIALQEDQVSALRKLGIQAFAVHSGMDESKRAAARFYFRSGREEASFLYVSPELLTTTAFMEQFKDVQFDRLAIDEAHCVSTWGNSFRPDFQRIRAAAERLKIEHTSAFTATIDSRIEQDIRQRLPLRSDVLKVEASPSRPNLILSRQRPPTKGGIRTANLLRAKAIFELLYKPEYVGPAIVYCSTQEASTSLFLKIHVMEKALSQHRHTPYLFHAGLPFEDKRDALRGFRDDERPLIIATSAFGMGINRADIRQIIHTNPAFTLIEYAQQIGRGGRDGHPALCTTFFTPEGFLQNETSKAAFELPDYDFVERIHGYLLDRLERLKPENRSRYNVHSFVRSIQASVDKSETIKRKKAYMSRVQAVMALLQKVGAIREDANGLQVRVIEPGSDLQLKLLEATAMHSRMELREKERLNRFFTAEDFSQDLLWSILREK